MTHDVGAAAEVPEAAMLVRALKASIERILGPSAHPDCGAVIDITMSVVGKLIADRAAARQRAAELETTLREVLGGYWEKGYVGCASVRTPWIKAERLEQWRRTLAGTAD